MTNADLVHETVNNYKRIQEIGELGDRNTIDLRNIPPEDEYTELVELPVDGYFILHAGQFALGSTEETVMIPSNMRCSLEGKSSLARMGASPHIAAGYIDPGFVGRITLELYNHWSWSIVLRPGDRIAQLAFAWLDKPCLRPYGHPELRSKYQNQTTVTGSHYRHVEAPAKC